MGHAKCGYETFAECCRNCDPCPHCYDLSVSKLRDIIYAVNKEIVDYSCNTVLVAKYGYSNFVKLTKEEFSRLLDYKDSLEKYYYEKINGYKHCLCPEEIQTIYERTLELVDIDCCKSPNRCDLTIDESGLDLWNTLHPGCVAFEDWERAFIRICPKLGITVKKIEDPSRLDFRITVQSLQGMCQIFNEIRNGNIKNPALALKAISSAGRGIAPKVTKLECDLTYNMLVTNTKCNLTYDVYTNLINCNISPTVIAKLLECNLELAYNVTKNTCDILVNPTTTVSLCDINFDINSQDISCELLAEATATPGICEQIAEIIEI